jgi:ankyrin repeat protein
MIDLLASYSADVDARDASGSTPLFLAVAAGRSENVKRLLAAGADKTIATLKGETPVERVRKMRRSDLVEMLE